MRTKSKIKDFDWDINTFKELSLDDMARVIFRLKNRLNDMQRIYREKRQAMLYGIDSTDTTFLDVAKNCRQMLNQLGFTSNSYYKDLAEFVAKNLVAELEWSKPHGPYSNELLAACIVFCILDYYNVKYDKLYLQNLYSLDEKQLIRMFFICRKKIKELKLLR